MSTAEAISRTKTISRVTFEEAFLRFGRSIRTPFSAIAQRPYNLGGAHAPDGRGLAGPVARRDPAGVMKSVDMPALGAGGASRGGSSPSARIGVEVHLVHLPTIHLSSRFDTEWPASAASE